MICDIQNFHNENTGQGTRWILPNRELPGWLKIIPILLWTIFFTVVGFFIFTSILPLLQGDRSGDKFFDAYETFLPVLFVASVSGTGAFWTSIWILGRSVIEISGNRLFIVDKFGILRHKRKMSSGQVNEITVISATDTQNAPRFLHNLSAIRFGGSNKGVTGAYGYPIELTGKLAEAIRSKLMNANPSAPAIPIGHETAQLKFAEKRETRKTDAEILEQPYPEGLEVVELTPGGQVQFKIRPRGFLKGSRGLGCFAIIWNLFFLVFAIVMIGVVFGIIETENLSYVSKGPTLGPPGWVRILFLVPFISVGIIMLTVSLKLGTATSTVSADQNSIRVAEKWVGGQKKRAFATSNLAAIEVGSSNMSVKNETLPELKLIPHKGKTQGLFRQLSSDQLIWIAALLRFWTKIGTTEMTAEASAEVVSDYRPKTCRVLAAGDGHDITIPKAGFFKTGLGWFSILWFSFIAGFAALLNLGGVSGWGALPFYFILGIFAVIGVGMVFFAIKRGSNEVGISSRSDRLTINSRSAFGTEDWSYHREEITNIVAVEFDEKINDVPVFQLEVHLAEEPKLALLKQLPTEELRWLASLLRLDLGLS